MWWSLADSVIMPNVTSWKGKGPPAAKVADAIAASLVKLRALVEKRPKAPPRSKL